MDGVVEVWWREVDEGVERWMVCVVVCEWSACVREVIVAIVGAPARSRRLRMRRVREVERGVGRLVEVDGGWMEGGQRGNFAP